MALLEITADAVLDISDLPDPGTTTWPQSVLQALNEMRQNHTLCDVVINTPDNTVFSVHSCVLGAGSNFFRQILKQSKTSNAGIVIRLEKSGYMVEKLLNFLYSGKTEVTLAEIEELKQMSEGYGLVRLAKLCSERMNAVTMTVVRTTDGGVALQTIDHQQVTETEVENIPDENEEATEYIVEMNDEYQDVHSELRAEAVLAGVVHLPDGTSADLIQEQVLQPNQNRKVKTERVTLPRLSQVGLRKTWRDYRYQCQYCRKVFTSLSRLKGHEATHLGEKRHECQVCGARFIQIEYLREHLSMHSDKRPFKCMECGGMFRILRHLKKHQKVHSSDRPFKCVHPNCTATFKRSDRLRVHIRTHTGERPFPCPVCEKRFKCMEALTRHKKQVHLEDCPFRCGFCTAGFKRIRALQEHMTVCKVGIRKTEHTCEHCGDLFKSRVTLIKHLQKHGAPIPPLKKKKKQKTSENDKSESHQEEEEGGEVPTKIESTEEVVEGMIDTEQMVEGEIMEVQMGEDVVEQVVGIERHEDIVQHALQLHEIQQGGGEAAVLLQRIANSDGEEAEALETALQLVQLEFVPGPGGENTMSETIQVMHEDGTIVEENVQIQQMEEVTEQ